MKPRSYQAGQDGLEVPRYTDSRFWVIAGKWGSSPTYLGSQQGWNPGMSDSPSPDPAAGLTRLRPAPWLRSYSRFKAHNGWLTPPEARRGCTQPELLHQPALSAQHHHPRRHDAPSSKLSGQYRLTWPPDQDADALTTSRPQSFHFADTPQLVPCSDNSDVAVDLTSIPSGFPLNHHSPSWPLMAQHDRKRRADEASQTYPPAKRQHADDKSSIKSSSHPNFFPSPAFWDNLSKVSLTRWALRELDRRNDNNPPKAATAPAVRTTDLTRFARHGGPDLRHLRGVRLTC